MLGAKRRHPALRCRPGHRPQFTSLPAHSLNLPEMSLQGLPQAGRHATRTLRTFVAAWTIHAIWMTNRILL